MSSLKVNLLKYKIEEIEFNTLAFFNKKEVHPSDVKQP